MYDFYPEWGPTRHRDSDDQQPAQRRQRYWQAGSPSPTPSPTPSPMPSPGPAFAMAGGPEARDGDVLRPDDN
jgi:hypothetical protein